MAAKISRDTAPGKRKSLRVLKNLDKYLKKLEMDSEVETLQPSQTAVDDKDFAKAAIRLIISSSRKDFITLCTKVALILKENHELRKRLNPQAELINLLPKINTRTKAVQKCKEDSQLNSSSDEDVKLAQKLMGTSRVLVTAAEVHKQRQDKFGDSDGNSDHFLLLSCPEETSENVSKIKRSVIKLNSSDAELSKYDRSTLDTISSESSENLKENVIQPKNETRKAVQFWKNKYFKQSRRIADLEDEKKHLEDQITFLESAKSANQEIDALSMELCSISEPRNYCGLERLLERLHDLPLLAPVPLQGCKCSQCECMFNPIYYSDFKDAKMYKLLSNFSPLLRIGDLVLVPGDRICQVSYIGHLDEPGLLEAVFVGLILKRPEGCSDGVHRGKRYFTCEDKYGLFLPINWIILIVRKARP